MRVKSIALHATEGVEHLAQRGAAVKVGDVTVFPHAGWYADLVLSDVSGPEFGRLEDAMRKHRALCFRPGSETYVHRREMAYVQIHNHKLVENFVMRGALTNPRLVGALAKELERLIQQMISQ